MGSPNLWLIDTCRERRVGVEETKRCGHCYEPLHLLFFLRNWKRLRNGRNPNPQILLICVKALHLPPHTTPNPTCLLINNQINNSLYHIRNTWRRWEEKLTKKTILSRGGKVVRGRPVVKNAGRTDVFNMLTRISPSRITRSPRGPTTGRGKLACSPTKKKSNWLDNNGLVEEWQL